MAPNHAGCRANAPTVSKVSATGSTPSNGQRPYVGLSVNTPQKEPGRRTDPAVWVPNANGTWPSATAAAEPLDDPPGVCPV